MKINKTRQTKYTVETTGENRSRCVRSAFTYIVINIWLVGLYITRWLHIARFIFVGVCNRVRFHYFVNFFFFFLVFWFTIFSHSRRRRFLLLLLLVALYDVWRKVDEEKKNTQNRRKYKQWESVVGTCEQTILDLLFYLSLYIFFFLVFFTSSRVCISIWCISVGKKIQW